MACQADWVQRTKAEHPAVEHMLKYIARMRQESGAQPDSGKAPNWESPQPGTGGAAAAEPNAGDGAPDREDGHAAADEDAQVKEDDRGKMTAGPEDTPQDDPNATPKDDVAAAMDEEQANGREEDDEAGDGA